MCSYTEQHHPGIWPLEKSQEIQKCYLKDVKCASDFLQTFPVGKFRAREYTAQEAQAPSMCRERNLLGERL